MLQTQTGDDRTHARDEADASSQDWGGVPLTDGDVP